VDDPITTVRQTQGLTTMNETAPYSNSEVETANKKLAKMRHAEVSQAVPEGENQWSDYAGTKAPRMKKVS
jgi:hypothetical protein